MKLVSSSDRCPSSSGRGVNGGACSGPNTDRELGVAAEGVDMTPVFEDDRTTGRSSEDVPQTPGIIQLSRVSS